MTPQQLKNSILQLAVEGKLVPQIASEGSADTLIKTINQRCAELINSKIIRNRKISEKIQTEELPFDIPKNWRWMRFGDLGEYKKGPFGSALRKDLFVPKGADTIKVYEQKNAIQKDITLGNYYITKEYFEKQMKSFEVQSGDIIVSCAGTIGETYIIPSNFERGIINQALMRMSIFEPQIIPFFLIYFDFILKREAKKESNGSALKNIPPFDILKNYVVPLPPLSEQKRIVEKLEELLPMVDKYGEAYDQLTELEDKFPKDLKKSILQYAMEGKLVPHIESEGNAEDLYQQIQKEKQKLIKEGKIKREKELAPISADELPFDIPSQWKWVRLGDVGSFVRGNGIKRSETTKEGCCCVRYGEMYTSYKGRIHITEIVSHTTEEVFKKCQKAYKDDILMAITGENKIDISLAATYEGEEPIAISGDMCKFTPLLCNSIFLAYITHSVYWINKKQSVAKGDIIVHISTDGLANMILPLPPLAEQKRIVAKIEELFSIIDKKEK